MPMFMDIHSVPGASAEDLRTAHDADMAIQHKHGVNCLKYWLNEEAGKVFCLFDAPSADAANAVHREAHGLLAEKIIEIDADMVDGFLGNGPVDDAGAVRLGNGDSAARDSAIRTVLFTDIVGSTALTQKLGDDAAMEAVDTHDEIVRAALEGNAGREVKHMGDGIMAAFISSAAAVRAACAIQAGFALQRRTRPGLPLEVRIGAAVGEPVEQRNDLFGTTVQLAARLCAHAEAGQIVVTNAVAELCLGKGLQFDPLEAASLKGFAEPVSIRAVRVAC